MSIECRWNDCRLTKQATSEQDWNCITWEKKQVFPWQQRINYSRKEDGKWGLLRRMIQTGVSESLFKLWMQASWNILCLALRVNVSEKERTLTEKSNTMHLRSSLSLIFSRKLSSRYIKICTCRLKRIFYTRVNNKRVQCVNTNIGKSSMNKVEKWCITSKKSYWEGNVKRGEWDVIKRQEGHRWHCPTHTFSCLIMSQTIGQSG